MKIHITGNATKSDHKFLKKLFGLCERYLGRNCVIDSVITMSEGEKKETKKLEYDIKASHDMAHEYMFTAPLSDEPDPFAGGKTTKKGKK